MSDYLSTACDERCLGTELEVAELRYAELEMLLEMKTDECAQLANSLEGSEHLRKAAEADNKRLREALEAIAGDTTETRFGPWPTKGSKIARAALEVKP